MASTMSSHGSLFLSSRTTPGDAWAGYWERCAPQWVQQHRRSHSRYRWTYAAACIVCLEFQHRQAGCIPMITKQVAFMAHTLGTHRHVRQSKSMQTAESGVSGYDLRLRFCVRAGPSESECHSSSRCSASAKSGDDADAPAVHSGLDWLQTAAACLLPAVLDVAFGLGGCSENVSQAGMPSSAHASPGKAVNPSVDACIAAIHDLGLPSGRSAAVEIAVTGWSSSH